MENKSHYLVGFGVSPEELSAYFYDTDLSELEAMYRIVTNNLESIQQDLRSYAQTGDKSFYLDVIAQLKLLGDPATIRLRLTEVENRREHKVDEIFSNREDGYDPRSR